MSKNPNKIETSQETVKEYATYEDLEFKLNDKLKNGKINTNLNKRNLYFNEFCLSSYKSPIKWLKEVKNEDPYSGFGSRLLQGFKEKKERAMIKLKTDAYLNEAGLLGEAIQDGFNKAYLIFNKITNLAIEGLNEITLKIDNGEIKASDLLLDRNGKAFDPLFKVVQVLQTAGFVVPYGEIQKQILEKSLNVDSKPKEQKGTNVFISFESGNTTATKATIQGEVIDSLDNNQKSE